MDTRACKEWKKNRLVSPLSRQPIVEDGQAYKHLRNVCGEGHGDVLRRWLYTPTMNPVTLRTISPKGLVYKRFERMAMDAGYIQADDRFKATMKRFADQDAGIVRSPRKKRAKKQVEEEEDDPNDVIGRSPAAAKRVAAREEKRRLKNIQREAALAIKKALRAKLLSGASEAAQKKAAMVKRDSRDICNEWLTDRSVNPRTGNKITEKGAAYKRLAKECANAPFPQMSPGVKGFFVERTELLTIDQRLNYMKEVAREIVTHRNGFCLSGPIVETMFKERKKLPVQWDAIEESIMSVFHAVRFLNLDFRVQELPICTKEVERLRKGTFTLMHAYRLMNRSLMLHQTPHLVVTGMPMLCDSCNPHGATYRCYCCEEGGPKWNTCATTAMELFDCTLSAYLEEEGAISGDLFANMLFQVLHALAVIQNEYGMRYSMSSLHDVLVRRVKPGGYWQYDFRGQSYYLHNLGVVLALSGITRDTAAMKPRWSIDEDFGERNVKRQPDGSYIKFTAKYTIDEYTFRLRKAEEDEYWLPTFSAYYAIRPSIKVTRQDLDDVDLIPPYGFTEDLVNLIGNFIGGSYYIRGDKLRKLYPIALKSKDDEMLPQLMRDSMFSTRNVTRAMRQNANSPPLQSYFYNAGETLRIMFGVAFGKRPKGEPIEVFKFEKPKA
jgi:2-cysteine adaptor domain